MKKFIFLLQACLLLAVSCAQNETVELDGKVMRGISVDEIVAVMPQVDMEGVKSTLSFDGSTLTTAWSNDDQIGFWPKDIYTSSDPKKVLKQAMFYVSEGGSSSARFKANGWGLLSGQTYYSYYPYDADAAKDCVTVDFSGQAQNGNDNIAHLASKDVFWGKVDNVVINTSQINYSRLATIAQFNLTLPQTGTGVKSMTLSSEENLFTATATFNPSSDSKPSLSASGNKSTYMTVTLNNVSSDSGKKVVVYAMMCPTAWSGKTINVTLTGTDDTEYTGTFQPGKNQEAGEMLAYNAELTRQSTDEPEYIRYNGIDYTNLCYGNEYANCYYLCNKGNYCFRATIKGNGYAPNGEETEISGATKAIKLWATTNHNVEDYIPTISDPILNNGYVLFSLPDQKAVNVCYAVQNSNNDILWSWHVWFSSGELATVNISGLKIIDRNLGAMNNENNYGGYGLFYQWGRKDPFPGSCDGSNMIAVKYYDSSNYNYGFEKGTLSISDAVKNPTKFYYSASTGHWQDDHKINLWGTTKTMYDPCPPGYRVIEPGFTTPTSSKEGSHWKISDNWWLNTGALGINDTGKIYVNAAQYWTCTAEADKPNNGQYVGNCWDLNAGGATDATNRISYAHTGNPVRCQKIQ